MKQQELASELESDEDEESTNKPHSDDDKRTQPKSIASVAPSATASAAILSRGRIVLLMSIFVWQNTCSALLGRYITDTKAFEIAHVVILTEVWKLVLSASLEQARLQRLNSEHKDTQPAAQASSLLDSLHQYLWQRPWDALRLAMPAALYFIQNALYYVALARVSVPLFQVTTHAKILLLTVLSTICLKRTYSPLQWWSVVGLTVGISIVTVFGSQTIRTSGTTSTTPASVLSGMGLLWLANLCSSTATIYFEKVIKATEQLEGLPPPSIWMRNIQLSLFSIPLAYLSQYLTSPNLEPQPFFHGFTPWVHLQAFLYGAGGLLVAALVRSTSSVHKSFAAGASVILSTGLSMVIFGTTLTPMFIVGTAIIIMSIVAFSFGGTQEASQQHGPTTTASLLSFKTFVLGKNDRRMCLIAISAALLVLQLFSDVRKTPNVVRSFTKEPKVAAPVSVPVVVDIVLIPHTMPSLANTTSSSALLESVFQSHDDVRHVWTSPPLSKENDCSMNSQQIQELVDYCERVQDADQTTKSNKNNASQTFRLKSGFCAKRRSVHALWQAVNHFRYIETIPATNALPEYLIIAQEDTWIQMDRFLERLGPRRPYPFAQQLIDCTSSKNVAPETKETSIGPLVLNRHLLENLLQVLDCTRKEDEFEKNACEGIARDEWSEAALFRNGMSILRLMRNHVIRGLIIGNTGACVPHEAMWEHFLLQYGMGFNNELTAVDDSSYTSVCADGKGDESCPTHASVCHEIFPAKMQQLLNPR